MYKKLLSLLLAVMLVVSVMSVGFVSASAATTDEFIPDPNKFYFDVEGTGWTMGTKNKVAFHIFGGDFGTEANTYTPQAWGKKIEIGAATAGENGIFEFDPGAKLKCTFTPGVQYKIIFVRTEGANWYDQTYDLLFTTDCLGKVAYCDGTEYENPVDSSKKTLAAFWREMDASVVGPVKQISSIGNVVGTCLAEGTTDKSLFNDFMTVVDETTGKTKYENAYHFVVEAGNKTEQQMIDDIGTGLDLAKQDIQSAITAAGVESEWDYAASPLHEHTLGEPVVENEVPATYKAGGSYDLVTYCTDPACGKEASRETVTTDPVELDPNKLYFDTEGTGWEMGTKNKVAFHIFGGDFGTEANTYTPAAWGKKIEIGAAAAGQAGVFEFDPGAKLKCTFTPGVLYKIIFVRTEGANWYDQTYDLFFTADCLGHVAYCDGTEYENPVDSSKKTLAAFWYDMDASFVGPVKQISSIGNVVGTCLAEGTTDESLFNDFLTVADETTGKTKYENAYHFVVEAGNKTEQQMIDDIGVDLALSKQQIYDAIAASGVESAWDYTQSELPGEVHIHTPGEPVIENDHTSTCTTAGSYDEVIYCTECHEEISRETKYHELAAHTPGDPVIENDHTSTCTVQGAYDEVTYCTVCQAELSRETKHHELASHTPGTAVQENVVPATCTAAGSYNEVVYCTECHTKLSSTPKTIAKLAHTPGTAVQENVVPATCTAAGSYNEVVYCTECHTKLSSTPKTIAKLAHTLSFVPEVPATETATGTAAHYKCSVCKKLFSDAAGANEVTAASLIIPMLAHTHTPAAAVQENYHAATCSAAGSYDEVVYCSSCHAELSRTNKTIAKLAHTPGNAAQENVVPATCTAAGSYNEVVRCTVCREIISSTPKTIAKLAHTPGTAVQENVVPATCTAAGSYNEVVYCTECHTKISSTPKTIAKLAHTPGTAVQENVVPATCTAAGSYNEVVYCTECHTKLSSTPKTIAKLAHTLSFVPEVPATETATGTAAHYECSVCKKLFSDAAGANEVTAASLIIPKLDHVHTPAAAVQENYHAATCSAAGSYDEVVYCSSCHAELSRTNKTIAKLAHTPGNAAQENVVPATCTAAGSYNEVVRCTVCREIISSTPKTIAKLAHTPGTAVQENVVPATCTAAGSYNEVVYCTECHTKLSSTPKTIAKLAHTLTYVPEVPATEIAEGVKAHYECSVCHKLFLDSAGKNEVTAGDLTIEKIEPTEIGKRGDTDGNGDIDIVDVTVIQRILANMKQANSAMRARGDVDKNGSLTITDATSLQRWLLGLNQDLEINIYIQG